MHSSAHNVFIVARREYVERVRTKAFLVMTLLTPALIFAWATIPSMMFSAKTGGQRHIVVASSNVRAAAAVKAKLEGMPTTGPMVAQKGGPPGQADIRYSVETEPIEAANSADLRQRLQRAIDSNKIDGFLWLDDAALSSHRFDYVARSTSDFIELGTLRTAVRDALLRQELVGHGISEDQVGSALAAWDMNTIHWEKGHPKKADENLQFLSSFILGFAMYMTVIIYGMGVLRAILEEKNNRVMEVLLSTLTTTELMAGKIIGVGMVGITQIFLWNAMGFIASLGGGAFIGSALRQANLSFATGAYFLAFFLLGFFLYSSMCAALGAMVNSEQEAQQLQFVVLMPLILSLFTMFFAMRAPNDPRIVVVSFIPFAAPLVMFTRIVVSTPPAWQIALSMALMVVGIAVTVWIASRIYRVGVLMYGKRPTLPEIIKWVRYA